MHNFAQFQFDPAALATPRKPGISAYMRIWNEQQFVRLAIESHLPFYDEIIAVYNNCTDDTEAILLDLQKQHHDKIKVFHYLPKVHPVNTAKHAQTPADSVHSSANYYNFALSKCTYSIAAKLDADHLAIPQNLALAIAIIRADLANNIQRLHMFSGINLIRNGAQIMCGGHAKRPFAGSNDICYHPLSPQLTYRQGPVFEHLIKPKRSHMQRNFLGILFFHLNRLRTRATPVTFAPHTTAGIYHEADGGQHIAMPFSEFASKRNHQRIIKNMKTSDQIRHALFRFAPMRRLIHRYTGHTHSPQIARAIRLATDLQSIDFKRDALRWLE